LAVGEDKRWMELRRLLEVEIDAVAWRLSALNQAERDGFIDDLTDRLCASIGRGQ
jgi:hypothetical protein